eukprot:scaffold3705_cov146-Isochrysis_galbana.AAC.1
MNTQSGARRCCKSGAEKYSIGSTAPWGAAPHRKTRRTQRGIPTLLRIGRRTVLDHLPHAPPGRALPSSKLEPGHCSLNRAIQCIELGAAACSKLGTSANGSG